MIREGMTLREAAERWVHEMDAIPQGMIDKLMRYEPDDWCEVTMPSPGNRVYVYDPPDGSDTHDGEIHSCNGKSGLYRVELDDGSAASVAADGFDVCRYDVLPMWGTMWSFHAPLDTCWIEEGEGIRALSFCGFRVYESEEFGYFFGIDGAGYDFYESHWIPLYKARGLRWHDPESEKGDGDVDG